MKSEYTDSEIEWMKKHGYQYLKFGSRGVGKTIWSLAFEYYNANHEVKIGMSCAPCYVKVLNFIIKKKNELPLPTPL